MSNITRAFTLSLSLSLSLSRKGYAACRGAGRVARRSWVAMLACVLALAVAIVAPTTAHAASIQDGKTSLTVASGTSGSDISVVAFAGYEWWVIGADGSGVQSTQNSITLFSKNYDFGDSAFRASTYTTKTDGYTAYTNSYGITYYFADKWEKTPNEYADSTLQRKMESIASGFSPAEQALIIPQNLSDVSVTNQKLWALSYDEWDAIANYYGTNNTVRLYDWYYWLRTPYPGEGDGGVQGHYLYGDGVVGDDIDLNDTAVRPALSFDASGVLFTSAASNTDGKGTAAVGGALVSAESPTATLKYTFKSSAQTVTVDSAVDVTSSSLKLAYSGATTGTNQYVSCVIKDSAGVTKYYGKLADCADGSAASGEATITLPGGITPSDVVDGTYTLYVFSEQANSALYSDFASEPVKVTLNHSYASTWSSNASSHWHECSACAAHRDEAAHSFKWVIDRAATATTVGSKHEQCSVCAYAKAAVEIPATGALPATGDTTSPLAAATLALAGVVLMIASFATRKRFCTQ